MKNDRNAFKAGLFIVGAILLGVAMLVAIRGTGTLLNPTKTYTAAFALSENLGGLKVGDSVRVGGYDQGRVTAIRFVPAADGGHRFEADFTLPSSYEIKADAVVQIEQGLTGTADLNVSSLGGSVAVADGATLDGVGSALSEFYAIAPQARQLVVDVRAKIDPAYQAYDRVMTRADTALVTGHETLAEARSIFGDTRSDLRTTISNLSNTTAALRTRLPETLAKLDAFIDTATAAVANTRGTLDDIRVAAANTKDTTAEAKSLLVRNRTRIDTMIAKLGSTSTNLDAASVEIRRSPWRLLYQPKAEELSNLNVYDSARQFAQGAQELNAAAAAVRDAMADPTIKTEQMAALMKTLDASFEKYRMIENKLWDAVK
jgi:ABC-type transporter Mla subunit MlaD